MTVSKSTLFGILLAGVLLGAGGMYLVVGRPPVVAGTGAASKGERQQVKGRSGADGIAPVMPSAGEASRELGHLLEEIDDEEGFKRAMNLVSAAAEWSERGTMEQLLEIGDPYKRQAALERLFRYWIGSDQEAALQAIEELDNVVLQRALYREAVNWLSQDDPAAAIALLAKSKNPQDPELWSRSFSNWAGRDREGAVARILAIEDSALRSTVLRAVAERLAGTDLAKALEWAGTLEGGSGETAMIGVLAVAARSDPEEVVAHLELVPAGRSRDEIIARAAGRWATRDPDGAIEWAETLGERERDQAIGEIAQTLLETDAGRAQEIADLLPDSERRGELLGQIARLRAAVSIAETVGWIESLPADDRAVAWAGTAREWARLDPQGAAEYAVNVEDGVARGPLVAAASASWAQRDPAAAAEWARNLAGPAQADAMNRIVDLWAREDPAAAGEFIATSLEGELQAAMTRQMVGRWMRSDMAQASSWIEALPDGGNRDGAVSTLINSIERDYPEIAMQWARTIGDARMREHSEQRLTRRIEK